MKPIILIPARMASSRLPGKPLADIAGVPMVVRVMRQAMTVRQPVNFGKDSRADQDFPPRIVRPLFFRFRSPSLCLKLLFPRLGLFKLFF